MNKSYLLLAALLLCVGLPLHAQGGCVQSPENPTVILALVGSAGAAAISMRDRFKAYRASRNK